MSKKNKSSKTRKPQEQIKIPTITPSGPTFWERFYGSKEYREFEKKLNEYNKFKRRIEQ